MPEYCVESREAGATLVLACQTPVHGALTLLPLVEAELPRLEASAQHVGAAPLQAFAPKAAPMLPPPPMKSFQNN